MAPKLQKAYPAAVSSKQALEGGLPASTSFKDHGKLKLSLLLSREDHLPWLAGETVKGWLELGISSTELGLGEVGVEFTGFEELRSRDYTSTKRILSQRVDFQGGSLPPSNAVVPNSPPKANGFYPALKGKTRFPFSFKLPKEVPSSCYLGGNATTRYELRAFASSILGENIDIRSEKKALQVVERWGDWEEGEWTKGAEKRAAEKLQFAGDGQLGLTVAVGKDEWSETPLRLFWRGDPEASWQGKRRVEVRARVKNASQKHVSGLKLVLCRRLRMIYPKDQRPIVAPPAITATVTSQSFNGLDYEFPAGEEREVFLALDVPPRDECWTKRKGVLFELDLFVRVEVDCGFLAKDLSVEIPIFIAHPTSLPPAAHDHIAAQLHSTAPAPAFPSLPAFPGASPTPAPYLNPYQVSPVDPYSDFAPHGLYSPATTATTSSVGQGHSMSSSSSQHAPLYHRPSVSAAAASPSPYFAPPPSVPPELAYGHQRQQYIAFDPNAPDLTQSHFLQSLQHQQPTQAYVPPNSSMSIGLGTPSPASTRTNSPTSGVDPSAPWGAPNGVVFAPPPPPPPILSPPPPGHPASQVYTAEPPTAHTSFSPAPHVLSSPYTLSHLPSSFSPVHARSPSPAELAQIAHNIGPIEGYSATTRARGRTESTPPASYQPIVPPNPSPSPVPMHRSHSASSISRERPPPPPSLSAGASRFTASPGPVSPLGGTAEGFVGMGSDPALLETIGEDGESQAGTARSVQAEMRKALAGLEEGNEDPAVLARRMEEAARISSPKATSRPAFASRSSLQDLEDMIQKEEEAKALEIIKTLPGPRVPSARTKPSTPAPKAQDIFAAPAVDPPRSPSKLPPRSEGGLSALEARLSSRPTTPSSTVERSMSPPEPSVTARALSPSSETGAGFGGALLARSLSRASSEAELRRRLAEESEDPKEVVRRAVEKASWASIGKAEGKNGEQSEESEVVAFAKPMAGRPTFVSKRKAVPSFESPATSPEPIEPASAATETPFTPTTTDAPAASLASPPPRLSPSAPSTSPLPSPTILNGRKVVDAAEVKGLQKEAVGRVSDWLKSDESGSNQAGEKAARRRTTDLTFGRVAPAPPGGEAGAALRSPPMAKAPSPWTSRKPKTPSTGEPAVATAAPTATPSVASTPVLAAAPRPSHQYTQSLPVNVVKPSSPLPSTEPTMAELLAAEERLGSTSAPATGKPSFKLGGKATRGLKTDEDVATRYDVRSARGGQGGIVASRANVWKERVQEVEREKTKSPPPPIAAPKALKLKSTPFDAPPSQPLSPLNNLRSTRSPSPATSPAPSPISSAASRSPAPAFLNTTLGKPAVLSGAVRAQPSAFGGPMRSSQSSPALSSSATSSPSSAKGRKVEELLARYKQQVAAQGK